LLIRALINFPLIHQVILLPPPTYPRMAHHKTQQDMT
jgi:hypothetical protein